MEGNMKIVINILKILSLVALTALIFALLVIPALELLRIARLSNVLLTLAITILSGAALWIEITAVANWIAASKANRKEEKVLSKKQSTILWVVLILFEIAAILLLGVSVKVDLEWVVRLLLAPTILTPCGIVLWLGVVVLIKQLLAKTPIS